MNVIVLTGQAKSGKSTIAYHLMVNHGYTRVRFAGILKNMLRELGLNNREVDGDLKEEPCSLLLGCTPRHAMQTLGTEWGRRLIHEDLWANAWKVQVTKELELGNKVVADDCRYLNEAEYARRVWGTEIWRVVRKDLDPPMKHSSESEFNKIKVDRTLKNFSTIGNLKSAVDQIVLCDSAA